MAITIKNDFTLIPGQIIIAHISPHRQLRPILAILSQIYALFGVLL